MLREALTGWDALREELAEGAGVQPEAPPDAALAGASAAQAVVDAVCALHQAGVIRYALLFISPSRCLFSRHIGQSTEPRLGALSPPCAWRSVLVSWRAAASTALPAVLGSW